MKKKSLFLVVKIDNYIITDSLIKIFKADINYIYMINNRRITKYLYHYRLLTP